MLSLRGWRAVLAAGVLATLAPALCADDRIKVLIVDGQNNHNWKDTTPLLKRYLEETGKFTVDVSTTPAEAPSAAKDKWDAWKPDFSKYQVVMSNYNGPAWPAANQSAFEKFVRDGGGLVNVHAANNAHRGWEEFEKMTGLLWRGPGDGWRLALNEERKPERVPPGKGPGAGHGPQHAYEVLTVDQSHPITEGMPMRWQHTRDELYHGQRGPAKDMHVLAVAFSDTRQRGTGMYEPMLWWIPYGKGKAVTCLLGHVGKGDSTDMPAMRCVGFKTIVQRATEWAATGKVTIPVPDNFPTADRASTVK